MAAAVVVDLVAMESSAAAFVVGRVIVIAEVANSNHVTPDHTHKSHTLNPKSLNRKHSDNPSLNPKTIRDNKGGSFIAS